MSRRNACLTIIFFALSFFALGKAPRLPERAGQDDIEMASRQLIAPQAEGADRAPRRFVRLTFLR
ncbi:hypothetical protein [Terrarubrum flagellatum]|uniref:hypothetical protein n=1 Tax=Terrirubrum flagellatum TaxID=2895980 RepID=UPI00314511A6